MRNLHCIPGLPAVNARLPKGTPLVLLAAACVGFLTLLPANAAATLLTGFESRVFAEASDLYAKDHTLIQNNDGVFHLFYSVGRADESWNLPGNEIDIGHATSTDLTSWVIQPRILPIDPAHGWKSRNIWAPHVIRADMEIAGETWPYLMAYTGVDSARNQQIGIAVSANLFEWTDLSIEAGAYHPHNQWTDWDADSEWQNCRDPFLFKQGNELVLLTSVKTRPDYLGLGTRGAIGMATSTDGLTWADASVPLVVSDHWTLMASSHMILNPRSGLWHLFYSRTVDPGGVHMLTSAVASRDWSFSSDTSIDPEAISSEITDLGGETLIFSRAFDFTDYEGRETRAVRFDDLVWKEDGPTISKSNPFWENWSLVEGALGALPTFRDRPGARTGVSSNVEGLFWVNTAEDDSGPYGGGCPTCPASEEFTGVLRSRTFVVTGNTMRLSIGGTASPLAYVALVDSAKGVPGRIEYGNGSDVMNEREWNLTSLLGHTVYLEIVDRDTGGHVSVDGIEELTTPTVVNPTAPVPVLSGIRMNPNPSPGPSVVSYDLERTSQVRISIYEASGRLVRRLAAGAQGAGRHEIAWDGKTTNGLPARAGTYFFRVEVDGGTGLGQGTRLTVVR